MTDEPDPHPDDTEAERLLGLLASAMREYARAQDVPEVETVNERNERLARGQEAHRLQLELQDALDGLHLPAKGDDYNEWPPKRTPPELPLLPGRPTWRTPFREAADDLVAAAVEQAHAALDADKRAEPIRWGTTALQVLDHHFARGEPLPSRALELLGRAMRIPPRSIVAWQRWTLIRAADEAGRTTQSIAAELGISEEAVRALRKPKKKTPALVNYAAVATAGAAGEPPDRATRDSVAKLLKVFDAKGRLRRKAVEAITSAPPTIEQRLVGVRINGRDYRLNEDLSDIAPEGADVEFILRDYPVEASGGVRQPEKVREAAREEAQRRLRRRPNGEEHPRNDAKALARLVGQDARDVAEWTRREWWETLVYCEEYWLREERREERRRTLKRNNTPPESEEFLIDYDRAKGGVRIMTRAKSQSFRIALRMGNQQAE